MVGLNPEIITALNQDCAVGRVLNDMPTDFIFAPQHKLLFTVTPSAIWDDVESKLKSGVYNPSVLLTSEVPKPSRLTRPGSILNPSDRIIYQAIADYLAPLIGPQLDRNRVLSYHTLSDNSDHRMFENRTESYEKYTNQIQAHCQSGEYKYAVVTDVSSYFFHINHHTLENLMTSAGVNEGVIRLLVKFMLETWSGRYSQGLPQGMYPSDLLGNFYLSALDTYLISRGITSVRYVDDIVMFHPTEKSAFKSLAPLCSFLRSISLDLNESKTEIVDVSDLVQQQSEIDRQFESVRDQIYDESRQEHLRDGYGFQDAWLGDELEENLFNEAEIDALNELWSRRNEVSGVKRDQLDKFCLGNLAGALSELAIESILSELGQRPHMTQTYCRYLSIFVGRHPEIHKAFCQLIENDIFVYDWELQWPLAALISTKSAPNSTVNKAIGILSNFQRGQELRALCAIFIGKFGSGASKTVLRAHWDQENSDHVRSAMIFSSMFFSREERQVLLPHWGSQSPYLKLVAESVRQQLATSK